MKTTVVVSKYQENVEWITQIKHDVIVYDKSSNPIENSISRPNVGREAETLLFYIISNYHSLPDIVIFLQGDPFPRTNQVPSMKIEEWIDIINKDHEKKIKSILTWEGTINIEENWLKRVPELHRRLFENYKNIVKYSTGAQYVIPKENMLKNPLDLYEALHYQILKFGHTGLIAEQTHINDGIDAWSMEATWYELLDLDRKINLNYKKNLQ